MKSAGAVVAALVLGWAAAGWAQSWRPLGPEGGEVISLAIDPRHPARVFAGTREGGVYRSEDGGAGWVRSSSGLRASDVYVLAADPAVPSMVWAATSVGLFQSVDDGASWAAVPLQATPGPSLWAMTTAPAARRTLYVASNAGLADGGVVVYVGQDAGQSWSTSLLPVTGVSLAALAVDPTVPDTLYAGTSCCGGGLFRSTNAGGSWASANTGLATLLIDGLAVDPSSSSTVYAATALGLHKSLDNAATWARVDGGLPVGRGPFLLAPGNSSTLYVVSGAGVYRSVDSALTFTSASAGLGGKSLAALAIDPTTPTRLYAGSRGDGVFLSANGGTSWAPANTGLSAAWVRAVASAPGVAWVGTQAGGAARSTNGGASWSAVDAGTRIEEALLDPTTPSTVYLLADAAVKKSINGGATWTAQMTGLTGTVHALGLAASLPSRLFASRCGTGVFRSDDSAGTWLPTGAQADGRCVQHLAIDPTAPDFVVASAGAGWGNDALLVSTNGGQAWTVSTTGLPVNASPGPVAIDPGSPRTVYLGLANGLYASTNDGTSWSALAAFPGSVNALRVDPANHVVYAASGSLVARSTDHGANWTDLTLDLPGFHVGVLEVGAAPDELLAGTMGAGLFALPIVDAGVDAGVADAGGFDAGADAGRVDAGAVDAGLPDAGPGDAGSSDAGFADAGLWDGGFPDAGFEDAGLADAGLADAGLADAGLADAGGGDSGDLDAGSAPDAGATLDPVSDSVAGGCGCGAGHADPFLGLVLLLAALSTRQRTRR